MSNFFNKKFKNKLFIFFIILFSLTSIISITSPFSAQAYNFNEDSGINISAGKAGFVIGNEAESVNSIIGLAISIILGLVGVLFLGLIILSGIRWMTAQGNEEKINKAKDSLINSLIGLIIALAAYAISYFLIGYFA